MLVFYFYSIPSLSQPGARGTSPLSGLRPSTREVCYASRAPEGVATVHTTASKMATNESFSGTTGTTKV